MGESNDRADDPGPIYPFAPSEASFTPGAITTQGKIEIAGPANSFSIKGTAVGQSNFGPVTGHDKFK